MRKASTSRSKPRSQPDRAAATRPGAATSPAEPPPPRPSDAPARARQPRLPWLGSEPKCAICTSSGAGRCADYPLTHGLSVWLCEEHRTESFLRRRGGRDFVESLAGLWTAAGGMNARQRSALESHITRVAATVAARDLPGSYAWSSLRAEAEERFAAGESPRAVIAELRARHNDDEATAPSIRTMRRWFGEARWLAASSPTSNSTRRARGLRAEPDSTRTQPRRTTINGSTWWYGWPVEWLPRGYP